jgi:hypothetical protein
MDNGDTSPAVRIHHIPSGTVQISHELDTQAQNRDKAMKDLITALCKENAEIHIPSFFLFEAIEVLPPNTVRSGYIERLVWHFKDGRWNYYIHSAGKRISKSYFDTDLQRESK